MKDYYLPFTEQIQHQLSANRRFKYSPLYFDNLDDNRRSEPHTHNFIQIWYTVSGSYLQKINGKLIAQHPGSVSFIYPYTTHQIDSLNSDLSTLSVITVSIDPTALRDIFPDFILLSHSVASLNNRILPTTLTLSGKDKELADHLLGEIHNGITKNIFPTKAKAIANVMSFLELCAKKNDITSSGIMDNQKEYVKCIDTALGFVNENYFSNIPASLTAREAMMSTRQFHRIFKKTTNYTYHEFLLNIRLNRAVHEIITTSNTIYQIADKNGFSHSSHLINTCSHYTGKTPIKLRDEYNRYVEDFGHHIKRRVRKLNELNRWSLYSPEE